MAQNPWEMNLQVAGTSNSAPTNTTSTTTYNTGNIRDNKNGGFKKYSSIDEGIEAHQELLNKYQSLHGKHTIREIINRWAPPKENDTSNYVKFMANKMHVNPDEALNFEDANVLGKFSFYQSQMEKGKNNPTTLEDHERVALKNAPKPWEMNSIAGGESKPTEQPTKNPWEMDLQVEEQPKQEVQKQEEQPTTQTLATALQPSNVIKGATLGLLGTRDKADLQHPLGYLSPYANINEVSPEVKTNAETMQNVSSKYGLPLAAAFATEGASSALMEGAGLTGFLPSLASAGTGSVAYQEAESGKVSASQTAIDMAGGGLLHGLGRLITPGSEAVRKGIATAQSSYRQSGLNYNTAKQAFNDAVNTFGMFSPEASAANDTLRKLASSAKETSPAEIYEANKGKIIPEDISNYNTETTGLTKGRQFFSKVGSFTEKAMPIDLRKLQNEGIKISDIKPEELVATMVKKGIKPTAIASSLAYLGMAGTAKLAALPAVVSALKATADKSYVRDVGRELFGKQFKGDITRNTIGRTLRSSSSVPLTEMRNKNQ